VSKEAGSLCGTTWDLCTERSGHLGSPSAVSNPHLCTDFVEPGDSTHGQVKSNPHHCTACGERDPK
jgi:hypothetical protein